MQVVHTATRVILEQRQQAPATERALGRQRPQTIARRLAHLLLLPRFGLVRPYQLRCWRPLGLVAAGGATLGYSALEHFLGDLEALRVAGALGDALAQSYLQIWPPPAEGAFFYLDNRRKVRYSGYPTAAGKISASQRILGGTTQLFLHDAAGHGLHMQSGPADDHLSRTLLPFVQHWVALVGRQRVRGVIADQEMRSLPVLAALDAAQIGFVTLGRTPGADQADRFLVRGLFVPYLRQPHSGQITHWIAPARTCLQERQSRLCLEAEVALVLDVRAGLPGRLIPVLHNLRQADLAGAVPHQLYLGRWEGQERVFRDMRPCQNLDAHYGQKKHSVPHRGRQRQRQALQKQHRSWTRQVATAQQKVDQYSQQSADLKQQARQRQAQDQAQVAALRQAGRQASAPRERQRALIQAERLIAQAQVRQLRYQQRQHRVAAQQGDWERKLAARRTRCQQVADALQALDEGPLYDFDLEKDDLMTYLRMAGENAHRLVQERYFAHTLLEKVDEATMVRLVYNQPGWVQYQGSCLHVVLRGYANPTLQAAVAQACQRVNQAQIELLSGHLLRMDVAGEISE